MGWEEEEEHAVLGLSLSLCRYPSALRQAGDGRGGILVSSPGFW